MEYLGYRSTYDKPYRGREIHCCQYTPDILCHVGGIQFGCFWTSTQAAVNAAQKYINRLIEEKEKKTL